jgi:hypothetical protein
MADWDMVNTDVVDWIRGHEFDLTYVGIEITPEQNNLLRKELTNFVTVSGYNMGMLTKGLEPGFGDNATIIASTESTRAYSEGNLTAWKESGVAEGKRWNTNNDGLVCAICQPLDNKVVPLEGEFPGGLDGPFAHPGCRCWVTPVMMEDVEPGDLIEMGEDIDGKVVAVEPPIRREKKPEPGPRRPWWKFWLDRNQ